MRLTEDQIIQRRAELLKAELQNPEKWWYLSFVDDSRGFLGAVIIKARGFVSATAWAHLLLINPGGECAGTCFPDHAGEPPQEFVGTLLSRDDVERFDKKMTEMGNKTNGKS